MGLIDALIDWARCPSNVDGLDALIDWGPSNVDGLDALIDWARCPSNVDGVNALSTGSMAPSSTSLLARGIPGNRQALRKGSA